MLMCYRWKFAGGCCCQFQLWHYKFIKCFAIFLLFVISKKLRGDMLLRKCRVLFSREMVLVFETGGTLGIIINPKESSKFEAQQFISRGPPCLWKLGSEEFVDGRRCVQRFTRSSGQLNCTGKDAGVCWKASLLSESEVVFSTRTWILNSFPRKK